MIDKGVVRAHAEQEINYIIDMLYAEINRELGIQLQYGRSGNRLTGNCPCIEHPGDRNSRAFSWRDDYRHWVCFTHHCEEEHGTDVIGLVQGVKGCGFKEALTWLQDILIAHGTPLMSTPDSTKTDFSKPRKQKVIDEQRLRFLEPKFDYLLGRGYPASLLVDFEIGLWRRPGTFMHNRMIFPLRDEEGRLVGFSGRSLDSEETRRRLNEGKWKHSRYFDRFEEIQTGSILYNLHRARKHIGNDRRIILVEGPLDGLRLEQAGIHNWVACLGTGFSLAHRSLLLQVGTNNLDIALDPDAAGDRAVIKIIESVKEFLHVRRIRLTADPGDTPIEQLKRIWPDSR